jgi:hypothetical protein
LLIDDKVVDAPILLEEEKDLWCLRASREVIFHAHISRIAPCGTSTATGIKKFAELKDYANDINNGIIKDSCEICINHESQGLPSDRTRGNELWKSDLVGNSHVEIMVSNKCNAACLHCSPHYSTRWTEIIESADNIPPSITHYALPDNIEEMDKETTFEIIDQIVTDIALDYRRCACVGIYGGDPAHSIVEEDHIGAVAKKFFSTNRVWNRRLRYDFATALNVSREKCREITKYLGGYHASYPPLNIVLMPKISGVGDLYEYFHAGCSWGNFKNNLYHILKFTDIDVEFNITVNSVNLPGIKEILQFCLETINTYQKQYNRMDLNFRILTDPIGLDCKILDESFLHYVDELEEYIKEAFTGPRKEQLLSVCEEARSALCTPVEEYMLSSTREYFDWIDDHLGGDLSKVNPALHNHVYDK